MKSREIIIGGVSNRDMLILVRQMHAAIKSGYNSAQALELAYDQSSGRLKQILDSVIKDVKHGAYLFEAFGKFQKYFSPLFISLIKTGELSASLEENLQRLVSTIDREHSFRQKLRAAMMYPAFVLIAVIGLGLTISIFVLPNLIPLFGSLNVDLPVSTKILLWFAELFDKYGLIIFILFIAFVIFLFWLSRRKFSWPFTHWLALKIPISGRLNKQLAMARFGRSLASLLRSGIPIDQSLKVTTTVVTNHYYQKAIDSILPLVHKGKTLGDSLKIYPKLFDNVFLRLLALGEATSRLGDACDNAAEYYEGEVDDTMKTLAVSIEPLLIIFVGVIVAFVAFSIIGPIYKITGSLQ